MRAKITFTSAVLEEDFRGRFQEAHWLPPFSQSEEEAVALKTQLLDKISEGDRTAAEKGAKLVLKGRGSSTGLFSKEEDNFVVRLFNDDVNLLRQACDEVVTFMAKYAIDNKKVIDFSRNQIEIREDKKEENVIIGRVIADKKEQRLVARKEKRIEYFAAIGGAVLLVALLTMTFPWYDPSTLDPKMKWSLDIAQKMIGSTIITAALSYLNYRIHLSSLRQHHVLWGIPGDPAFAPIKTPTSA